MKILMITDRGFEQGGVSSYLLTMKALLEQTHTVRILTSNQYSSGNHFSDYEFRGFNNTPFLIQLIYRLYNPYSAIELNRILKSFNPDIVHLHFIFGNTSPSILPRLKHVPTVMTVHCPTLICPLAFNYNYSICKHDPDDYCRKCVGTLRYYYNRLKYLIYKSNRSNIDLFLSNSRFLERSLRKANIAPVKTIYLGIDLLGYSKIVEWNNLVYVGRIDKEKGLEYLLRAMPIVIDNIPDAHLEIVGDGSEKENSMRVVRELGIGGNVTFVGWVPSDRIEQYYRKSTIVVVPSLWPEAFGLVGVEAMSVGRPVIASRVGGIPEWLDDGKTGFLVAPGNSEQIAERAIQLLSDRELLEQMGKNARQKAEQFSIDKHVTKIDDIYRELIEKYKTKAVV